MKSLVIQKKILDGKILDGNMRNNMKKLIYLLLAGVIFCGCSKLEDLSDSVQQNTQQCILPDVIYASVSNEAEGDAKQTRTYVKDDKYVLWHGDDAISYFTSTNHNVKYQYNGEDGVNNANFNHVENTGSAGTKISTTYAVYPYSASATVFNDNGVEKLVVTYPNQQNYAPNSFGKGANVMVSAGNNLSDNNLYFRNACGYLIVKLYGEGVKVKNIKLTALGGEKLSGKAHIVAKQDAAPLVEMGSGATSTVTLNCGDGVALGADSANATEFWFALPPVTFENGLRIDVTDTDGRLFKMQTTKKVVITRNDIQPMAALKFENSTPGNNMLWYTTKSGNKLNIPLDSPCFYPIIYKHEYDSNIGKYYISFKGDLETIRGKAFANKDITSITLPQSLHTIEEEAFYQCKDLTSITIPGSVTKIGYSAFYECTSLHTVNFEEGDANLEIGCAYTSTWESLIGPFYYSPLETIILNREMVYKDKDGDALTATNAYEGIFCIEKSCAWGDSLIETSFIIGEKVKTIPNYMLAKLGMKSLVIPGNVTRIGNNNFELCYELNSIKFLPGSEPLTIGYIDKAIDKGPFYDCQLELIDLNRELNYLNDGPGGLNAWDEGVFASDTNWGASDDSYMDGMGEQPIYTTKVNLGPNVKEISDWMFAGTKVELIWIPREITKIGKEAFSKCKKFKGLTCNHITPPELGEGAFDGTKFDEENAAYIAVLKGSEEAFKLAPGWKEYADKIRTW